MDAMRAEAVNEPYMQVYFPGTGCLKITPVLDEICLSRLSQRASA